MLLLHTEILELKLTQEQYVSFNNEGGSALKLLMVSGYYILQIRCNFKSNNNNNDIT